MIDKKNMVMERCRKGELSAFTLIELLVVIAIIAILAALLLPALAAAKKRSWMAVDISNTRQILLGAMMYGSDNHDSMPGPGWWDPTTGPGNNPQLNCWAAAATINGHPFPLGGGGTAAFYNLIYPLQLNYFKQGELYRYLKTPKVLRSPSDPLNDAFYKRQEYLSSYVWNGGVVRYATPPNSQGSPLKFTDPHIHSNYILQWENDPTLSGYQWNDFANFPDQGLSRVYGEGAVVGCMDGSSKRMSIVDFYKLAGTYPTGNPPGGGGSGRGNTSNGNDAVPPNPLWWF